MSIEETRRSFLRNKCLAAAGAVSGAFLSMTSRLGQASTPQSTSPEQRLRELGIELPPPPRPVAVYVPAVRYCQVDVERANLSRRADFLCSHRTAQVTSCQTMKARSRSSR